MFYRGSYRPWSTRTALHAGITLQRKMRHQCSLVMSSGITAHEHSVNLLRCNVATFSIFLLRHFLTDQNALEMEI